MTIKSFLLLIFLALANNAFSQDAKITTQRQHLSLDNDWKFAFGHPYDTKLDYNNGTSYFSYLTKAGYGDGAAASKFDDRSWRKLDLPHDWAVEVKFAEKGSFSHGFKAVGRKFPENSVGWYRKNLQVPQSDYGKRITIAFDGVYRNSIVWVNGHYLGNEQSGYNSFEYDITDYLNYGGDNTIAVRADATMEEGWFYEGAGIYRHVWLNKTNPLHVATNGTFVTTSQIANTALINTRITVQNDSKSTKSLALLQQIYDQKGGLVVSKTSNVGTVPMFKTYENADQLVIKDPILWSVDQPYRYKLITTVLENNVAVDRYETRFGIRTISFDANKGFFLNGMSLKIKGTNNHQDHAGVGSAMPDELQYFRIASLKSMGSNAYRCSHNIPTPELLEACDSLGMLVIDENRLMGITDYHLGALRKMIERDRNHPSIISWSIGNEEWGIENSEIGARIATTMQAFVKSLDTTRSVTAAFSGGWGNGIASVIDLMGYNYLGQEKPDEQHRKFPWQKGWGTEEGSTFATRGIYFNNDSLHYKSAYDEAPRPKFYSIENGWKFYAEREFLAGMFIWTGFDYRGEPTPYSWPSVGSYFGMLDQCGFPKDNAWYLRSWWGDKPVLHLLPHWNLKGKEGQQIAVWAYSNCDEVELFLNKKSQGRKTMPKNGHLEWAVRYVPGELKAIGYKAGKQTMTETVKTTGASYRITLTANKVNLKAGGKDIALITVGSADQKGLQVPDANNPISFALEGPGRIIGVGNGDPTSIEPDKYLPLLVNLPIENFRELAVNDTANRAEVRPDFDDSLWKSAFSSAYDTTRKAWVYRGSFNLTDSMTTSPLKFFYKSIGKKQSIYVNGKLIVANLDSHSDGDVISIDNKLIKAGRNTIAFVVIPLRKKNPWDNLNTEPGVIQFSQPAEVWKRKLFSGLAQVIVQSEGEAGKIKLTATSPGLKTQSVALNVK